MENWTKEAKKDYLFKQSKIHSSNTVPTFSEIWKELCGEDRFKEEIEYKANEAEKYGEYFNADKAWDDIENEQRNRYSQIVEQYKNLNGAWCWRTITVPSTVDPRKLEQLGIYWAVEESAAEAHWGTFNEKSIECTYQALIDLHNVDWTGTMFARMNYVSGDDEQEIRFLKNAPIMVRSVDVAGKTYFINNRRRA